MSQYLHFNAARTSVSSGGTTAPSAGTSESWTVASSTLFTDGNGHTATTGSYQFAVVDPADTSSPPEVMLVTNVSGTTWTVTRGAEGTAPVAHTVGFTVKAVPTSGSLTNLTPTLGTLAAMPTSGTGSMQLYWASDDQGGTLYQDQTSGGAYTKVAASVGQTAGQELAYAEITANVTTTALGLANRVDATGLVVSATVTSRPVLIEFFGSVFNTTINDGVGIQIVEAAAGATNTPLRQQTQMISAGVAGAVTPVNARVRLNPTAGTYSWKVMFNATVGGTATVSASTTQPAFIRVTSG